MATSVIASALRMMRMRSSPRCSVSVITSSGVFSLGRCGGAGRIRRSSRPRPERRGPIRPGAGGAASSSAGRRRCRRLASVAVAGTSARRRSVAGSAVDAVDAGAGAASAVAAEALGCAPSPLELGRLAQQVGGLAHLAHRFVERRCASRSGTLLPIFFSSA